MSANPEVWVEVDHKGLHYKLLFRHICNEKRIILHTLPDAIWEIVKIDPLTVRPRINCGFCGLSGFFSNGAWEDATRR